MQKVIEERERAYMKRDSVSHSKLIPEQINSVTRNGNLGMKQVIPVWQMKTGAKKIAFIERKISSILQSKTIDKLVNKKDGLFTNAQSLKIVRSGIYRTIQKEKKKLDLYLRRSIQCRKDMIV